MSLLLLSKTKGRKRSVAFGESSYKKHPGGLEAHALLRAHTQKKARARVLIAALLCHRHASIDRFRPVVHRHFLAGSRWFRWTDDTRETDIEIAFFPIGFFFDARCTAIFPSALRSIQNALEAKKTPNKLSTRARENTQKTHTQRRRRRRQRRKETTTTHPCIARLPISPIRPIRRRTFPKTPPRPRLVSLWMPTPTTPTPRPSSRTRSFSSSHNNTCCFFCRRRP